MGCEFIDISTPGAATAKWMPAFDSVHQIGLSTFFGDVLTVVWGFSSANQNDGIPAMGCEFIDISTTSAAIAK